MKYNSSGSTVGMIIGFLFGCVLIFGYFLNIYKLATSDFEAPYFNEGFRVVGVVAAPVGVILGYIDFKDEK